jgi:hypothetical protein
MRVVHKIAALLMLLLMMPLPRACAAMAMSGGVQHACCQPHVGCCEGAAKRCGAAQTPAHTMLLARQSGSAVVWPAVTLEVLPADGVGCAMVESVLLARPAEHSPPGLLIAATIVLRV